MLLTNPLTRQTLNANPEGCNQHTGKNCARVHDVKTLLEGGIKRHEGVVSKGQTGYRSMSGREITDMVERIKQGKRSWYSRGDFTSPVEKRKGVGGRVATTMFGLDPDELIGETAKQHKWDALVEADLSDLPFSSIADLTEEGLRADLGRGLGVSGEIPIERIKRIQRLSYKTGIPEEDITYLIRDL